MQTEEKENIINKLARNGIWEQLNQLQEECGEVIAAVNRLRRKKQDAYIDLCTEIADLKIMVSQMEILLDKDLIHQKLNEKLLRARERIQNGQL